MPGRRRYRNLGTNGGGAFNINGAHPHANPTPAANFVGMLAIAGVIGIIGALGYFMVLALGPVAEAFGA